MEINERVNGKCECDVELEAVDTAIVIRDPYWGDIKGDIYKQEDLQQEFGLYRKRDDQDVIDNEIKENLANEITRATTVENELRTDLDAEVQRATNAETTLTNDLNTEVERAKQSEKTLETNLNAEIERSTNKDNELETNLSSEIERAKSKENEIAANLETETSSRISEDNALSSRIDSEASSRESNDNILNEKIETETTRAKGVEETLRTDLDNEIKRAAGAESTLDKKIDSEVAKINNITEGLTTSLDNEIKRATNVENKIASDLSIETQRATGVENTLRTDLDNEIKRAKQSEADNDANIQTLNKNLASEVNRATGKENEIAANLSTEIERATNKENSLDTKIDNEISRATNAEQKLTSDLSTEVSDRKKEDTNLQTQIDAINSRSDVVDVVATKAELDTYDKDISINDIVKVLQDGTHDNATSYYRNTVSSKPYVWEFIGSLGPYYTQGQTDGLINNEATLRESKDNELNTKIDTEIDRAKKAEQANTTLINNEVTRAKGIETTLRNDLDAEIDRATGVEATLSGKINTNIGSITTLNTEVDKIKVKNSDQDVKIEKLQSDVVSINAKDVSQDNEIASIKNKNKEQDTLIDTNTGQINTLSGKIDDEINARIAALKTTLLLNGSNVKTNPVNDLNNFKTGIGYFDNTVANRPPVSSYSDDIIVISAINEENTSGMQISYAPIDAMCYYRYLVGDTFGSWWVYVIDELNSQQILPLSANQGRILNEKIEAETTRATNVENTKLDKISAANKVYGTDDTGAQTTYDVSKLGQVDDVVYNSKSLVSDRIANLNGFLTYSDEELS